MDVSQNKEKIKEIIRRSSIRNYFTPLLPKHSERPKLSKLSKILLKYQEPKKLLSNSPVSIRNYKNISRLTPITNESVIKVERRFSRMINNKLNFSQETHTPVSKFLSPLRNSTELSMVELGLANHTPEIHKKENFSATEENSIPDQSIPSNRKTNASLHLSRNERLLKISQIKCIVKENSFIKTQPKVKQKIYMPKYVSIGEGTDDNTVNGWELNGDSPELY
jgi:hypothetical protein